MAAIRDALVEGYHRKLELQEARFKQRLAEQQSEVAAFKVKLTAAEQREKAAEAARVTAEAELSSLHQQVEGVTSLVERTSDEVCRR